MTPRPLVLLLLSAGPMLLAVAGCELPEPHDADAGCLVAADAGRLCPQPPDASAEGGRPEGGGDAAPDALGDGDASRNDAAADGGGSDAAGGDATPD